MVHEHRLFMSALSEINAWNTTAWKSSKAESAARPSYLTSHFSDSRLQDASLHSLPDTCEECKAAEADMWSRDPSGGFICGNCKEIVGYEVAAPWPHEEFANLAPEIDWSSRDIYKLFEAKVPLQLACSDDGCVRIKFRGDLCWLHASCIKPPTHPGQQPNISNGTNAQFPSS